MPVGIMSNDSETLLDTILVSDITVHMKYTACDTEYLVAIFAENLEEDGLCRE